MKNFSLKNGFGIGAIILAVATVIALPLRTFQFFTVLEGGTGFYKSYDVTVYILYALLIAATLAFIILGFIKRKKLDFTRNAEKRPVAGIFSLLTAAAVFFSGLVSAYGAMNDVTPIIEYDYLGTATFNSEKMILYVQAVFAVISAMFFLSLGIVYLSGKNNGSNHKLISLAPIMWCIVRMVLRFTRTISYQRVSDLTFELVMLAFMIMFFMAFAQVNAQIGEKNCEWKLAGYGLPAALFGLVCFVPRFIVTVMGETDLLYSYSTAEFCDIAVALFICSIVFTRLTDRVPLNAPASAEETSAEG